jgi:Cu/Ag efflux protein CusF
MEETIMKFLHRLVAVLSLALLIAAATPAQTASAKKSSPFHGKVESVSPDGLTVNSDKVEVWKMDAMTMKYKVDDPKILKTLKAGDEITATVYEGDYSLHKVQVVAKSGK